MAIRAVDTDGQAELVAELQRRWQGFDFSSLVVDRIVQTSPLGRWPQSIRCDFTVTAGENAGEKVSWEWDWPEEDFAQFATVDDKADWWIAIVSAHWCEHGYM